MKKTCLFFALAAALSLTACGDPDDQHGDPQEPTQQTPATEREAQQQELREDTDVNEEATSDATNLYADIDNLADFGNVDDPQQVRTHQQEHTELQGELRALLQRTQADSREQCAMIPYGHKPCGGPEAYIVYSQKDMSESDIEALHEKVQRYNQLDAFIKSSRQIMSTCEITPQPEIRFENGRCIADSRAMHQQIGGGSH